MIIPESSSMLHKYSGRISCPNAGAGLWPWSTCAKSHAPLALDDYTVSAYIQANHCVGTIHTLETARMRGLHLT